MRDAQANPQIAAPRQDAELARQLDDHVGTARAMEPLLPAVQAIGTLICQSFAAGGVLYTFGNGGSAADAQHFTGELIGHYKRDRAPLPAVTLTTDPTVMTCVANDYTYDDVFARQVEALARPGDVVAAFTTSGRSPNIVAGLETARKRGATTVLFAGGDGGNAYVHADHALLVPSTVTARIQEMHTLAMHLISEIADIWAVEVEHPS
ncbi:D-sedoheptulose-7-phosphate isomerase [Phytoactinopolyspora halotolerans]|uniref:SIS domain-containing protein n=1 Tax=Phytoactinopolyspora halotolerans TaxID=1981512 RepID=A0A6L9S2P7_9ACTN|nr:SIS domain-containing protein [Phytoactinopolyspora halotolerans]NED99322.1 SIS domain-containing protein [Phytoactinopolyspora halotolerans]